MIRVNVRWKTTLEGSFGLRERTAERRIVLGFRPVGNSVVRKSTALLPLELDCSYWESNRPPGVPVNGQRLQTGPLLSLQRGLHSGLPGPGWSAAGSSPLGVWTPPHGPRPSRSSTPEPRPLSWPVLPEPSPTESSRRAGSRGGTLEGIARITQQILFEVAFGAERQ